MPIDFTERLHGEIKKVALEFIRRFIKHHWMMDITDTPYFEMSESYIDCVDFEQLDNEEKRICTERKNSSGHMKRKNPQKTVPDVHQSILQESGRAYPKL